MQKITYIKNVKYYNKKMEPIDTVASDKKTFSSLNDAIEMMKSATLHYVDNPKGISAYEEIIIWDKTDQNNWYSYTKKIDISTKEIKTNLAENRGERM